uniref:Trehalose 6-phosphate phosphatase n=1 Tax=Cannabis sativa TaxID=3483 RepID=A0A803NLU5_CANSA
MRFAVKTVARYFPTAIVSGRCRDKVYDFVKLPELYYAGSHGMDIKGPTKITKQKKIKNAVMYQPAAEFSPMIDEVYTILVEETKSIPGVRVEHNKFCLSVHFRCVDENNWDALADQVKVVLTEYPKLKLTQGRKVLEIRPTIKWDKGKALEFLLESLGYPNANQVLPLYIGDDQTDEDAFKLEVSLTEEDLNEQDRSEVMEYVKCLDSYGSLNRKYFEELGVVPKRHVSSVEKPPELELKVLPDHLRYEFLGNNKTLPVIVLASLFDVDTDKLLRVHRAHTKAIGWTLADIKGISPSIVMHQILMEDGAKPSIDAQRRLNPPMKEVVRKEVAMWLDAGVAYPILASKWVSPENAIWTMNAPSTFQRCMMAIFSDLIEGCIEIFMNDFLIFGSSFHKCLRNMEKVLIRYEESNLVLNWEKFHFMVKEEIVLGHKISRAGIEVDRANVFMIGNLPPPISVTGVWSFLGRAGFYQRFIKDFSKISKPLSNLLVNGVPFEFGNECLEAFQALRRS